MPRPVHERLARRAGLSEVQVLGGLADEYPERIIRRVLEEARARGRDELTQARPDMTASDALAAVEWVRQLLSRNQMI